MVSCCGPLIQTMLILINDNLCLIFIYFFDNQQLGRLLQTAKHGSCWLQVTSRPTA